MAMVDAGQKIDSPFMHEWMMDAMRDTDGYATCRKCGAIENTHWSVMLCAFVKPLRDAIGDDPAAFIEAVRRLVEAVGKILANDSVGNATKLRDTLADPALAKVREK